MSADSRTKRCPAGYLIGPGSKLCGRGGNNCIDRCVFHYLARAANVARTISATKETTNVPNY